MPTDSEKFDLLSEAEQNNIYKKWLNYENKYHSENAEAHSKKFQSSHFDEPNILVHLRMNTRTDAQGKKVLFLEEVQSDWGQKGKKEGFSDKQYNITYKDESGTLQNKLFHTIPFKLVWEQKRLIIYV